MHWRTLGGKPINMPIGTAVQEALAREREAGYSVRICIGTDSQVYASHTEFATAIVVLREGRGGFMFIRNERKGNGFYLKERMLQEVSMSIGVAYELSDMLRSLNVRMEVHVDINTCEQYASNAALSEAVGYILGMGFDFKTKPDAFASSYCADKAVN